MPLPRRRECDKKVVPARRGSNWVEQGRGEREGEGQGAGGAVANTDELATRETRGSLGAHGTCTHGASSVTHELCLQRCRAHFHAVACGEN